MVGFTRGGSLTSFFRDPNGCRLLTGARIVARRSGIYLTEDIDVRLPCDGPPFTLCDIPEEDDRPNCRLGPGLYFQREQLLNQHLGAGIRLQKGQILWGFLLMVADRTQLPREYLDNDPIAIRVWLFDSLGTEDVADGVVGIDRRIEERSEAGMNRRIVQPPASPAGSPLFDEPVHRPHGSRCKLGMMNNFAGNRATTLLSR